MVEPVDVGIGFTAWVMLNDQHDIDMFLPFMPTQSKCLAEVAFDGVAGNGAADLARNGEAESARL